MYAFTALLWNPHDPIAQPAAEGLIAAAKRKISANAISVDKPGLFAASQNGRNLSKMKNIALADGRGVFFGRLFPASGESIEIHSIGPKESRQLKQSLGSIVISEYWGRYVGIGEGQDPTTHFVVRDPSGGLNCYYTFFENVCIVFNSLDACLFLDKLNIKIDWEYVTSFMMFGAMATRRTGLIGITELLPGERLILSENQPKLDFVWHPHDFCKRPLHQSGAELRALVKETVDESIGQWGSVYSPIFLQLSGGLDSSIVLSSLKENRNEVTCLNIETDEVGNNDRFYAREMASYAGVQLLESNIPQSRGQLEEICQISKLPFTVKPHRHYVDIRGTKTFNRLAIDHGAGAIFRGEWGDHIFFHSVTAATVSDFLLQQGIAGELGQVIEDVSRITAKSVWVVMIDALAKLAKSDPANVDFTSETFSTSILAADTRASFQLDYVIHPWLQSNSRLSPGQKERVATYATLYSLVEEDEENEFLDFVDPIKSQPIMELFLRIPTYRLIAGGRRRGLVRQAFSRQLPEKVVNRKTKGGMMARQYAMPVYNDRDFVADTLLNGRLVDAGVLDPTQLRARILSAELVQGSGFFADIVRCYLGFEMWVQKMESGASSNYSSTRALYGS